MGKIIVSINAGSSSVKLSVYEVEQGQELRQIAEAQVNGLTDVPPKFKYARFSKTVYEDHKISEHIDTQDAAFRHILAHLLEDDDFTLVTKKEDIDLICHRVVHGGDYETPQIIKGETIHRLEALTDLAPLHNAFALQIVRHCIEQLPSTRNVAVFDSQFHQTIPEHIRTYPINAKIAKKNGLRKYGFHGISYSWITRSVSSFLGKAANETNLIMLHLGSGASACVVKNGNSLDTSMGLSPVAGLPGATRSGDVDPSLVFHYARNVGEVASSPTDSLHISRAEEILNKESGWRSLTGTTNFATIASSSDPKMKLALDIFVDRICGFVASYYVSLQGAVDALVFAGGIGEKSDLLRSKVTEQVACLGFEIDSRLNQRMVEQVVQDIGKEGARHRTLVCQTDEQLEMARLGVQVHGL